MSTGEGMPGAYGAWNFDLTPEARQVLTLALQGLMGETFDPIAFATQVVEGTNYCYLCKAMPVVQNPMPGVQLLYVFQPLGGGDPVLQQQKTVDITPDMGS